MADKYASNYPVFVRYNTKKDHRIYMVLPNGMPVFVTVDKADSLMLRRQTGGLVWYGNAFHEGRCQAVSFLDGGGARLCPYDKGSEKEREWHLGFASSVEMFYTVRQLHRQRK